MSVFGIIWLCQTVVLLRDPTTSKVKHQLKYEDQQSVIHAASPRLRDPSADQRRGWWQSKHLTWNRMSGRYSNEVPRVLPFTNFELTLRNTNSFNTWRCRVTWIHTTHNHCQCISPRDASVTVGDWQIDVRKAG